ncbi:MAG: PAS domain-containing protein [Nitrospirae bacterium]|nr:PAS domain-containing protein [Nitrospirota bacterium]
MLMRRPVRVILYIIFATVLIAVLFVNLSHKRANIERIIQQEGLSLGSMYAVARETRNEAIITAVIIFILGITALSLLLIYEQYRSARRSLSAVESLSSNVLRSITRGVIVVDLEGKISSLNKAAETILNLKGRNLSGTPFREIWNKDDRIRVILEKVLEDKELSGDQDIDYYVEGKGRLSLRIDTTFLEDDEGKTVGIVILIKDLTEAKQLETQMRRADKLASLGRLAAGIAHEIKNPLSAMSINHQLLEEEVFSSSSLSRKRLLNYLNIVGTETKRLEGIVQNFLRFAKPPPLELSQVNINRVLDGVLALIGQEAVEEGIKISKNYHEDLPRVQGDKEQLSQAFLNIVINSLQAMAGGGQLTIRTAKGPRHIELEISDTGRGIALQDQEKIFELYFTTKEGGTGLGLPITQRIIQEHRGWIGIESKPGEGTKFRVNLPLI